MSSKSFIFAVMMVALTNAAPLSAEEGARPSSTPPSAAEARRPADAPLRAGMEAVRSTIATRLAAADGKALQEAEFVSLADTIDRQINDIVAGRDFHTPDGRYLQWLLGDLGDGATLMRTAPRAPGKRLGLMKVVESLNLYGRAFNHPGWQSISYQ